LREVSLSEQAFADEVIDEDRNYRNKLIEMFGTPYEGTIGPGKAYPAGYKGPDYYFIHTLMSTRFQKKPFHHPVRI
jgi:hypothetical protein